MTAPVDGVRATLALGARALPPGSSVALALAGARLRIQAVTCQGAAPTSVPPLRLPQRAKGRTPNLRGAANDLQIHEFRDAEQHSRAVLVGVIQQVVPHAFSARKLRTGIR